MASAFTNYNQDVYLNRMKIKGVKDISMQQNIETKPINILGKGCINQVISNVPEANVSITRDIAFVDFFQSYTGINKSIIGSINYGNNVIGFDEGHLTSYSYSVEYGQTPVSNIGITVYGNMGSGDLNNPYLAGSLNASGTLSDASSTKITRPSDISLSCFGSTTNRIKSFSVDVSVPKMAIYGIYHSKPLQVSIGWPIEVNTNFIMEVDDFESRRIFDYLSLSNFDTFSIIVNGIITDNNVLTLSDSPQLTMPDGTSLTLLTDEDIYQVSQTWSFASSNTRLISTDFSSSSEDINQVSLNYKTYLTNNKRNPLWSTGPTSY
jgi:hypothetical protein